MSDSARHDAPTRPWSRRRGDARPRGGDWILQITIVAFLLLGSLASTTGCSTSSSVGELISTDPSGGESTGGSGSTT